MSMMVIQHNMVAMNGNRMLGITTGKQAKSSEKLSSGYKINRAADDAAGLSISEKMRRQIRGLTQGANNILDGVSVCQIADGALHETQEMLHRMNELAIKSANGTLQNDDRNYLQQEVRALRNEINRVANTANFNEHVFPLLGKPEIHPYSSIEEINSIIGIHNHNPKLSTSVEKYEKLRPFIETEVLSSGSAEYIDIVLQLNSKDRTLDAYAKDGTLLVKGECNYGGFTTGTNYFPETFESAGDQNYVAIINTPNEFFDTGSFYTRFFLADELPMDMANNALSQRTIRWYPTVYADKSKVEISLASISQVVTPEIAANIREKASTAPDPIWIQSGAEKDHGMYMSLVDATASGLGIGNPNVRTQESALATVNKVKAALETVSKYRSHFGATQNRLEHAYRINSYTVENTTAAESRIRDTDMAKEMVAYSNNNVLAQAGQAMLANANQSKQGILTLLG